MSPSTSKKQKVDLIETPVANFVIVEDENRRKSIIVQYLKNIPNYSELNKLSETHIKELAAEHPEFYLAPFNIKYLVSENLEGKLGECIEQERVEDFVRKVQQYRNERKDIFAKLEQLASQEDRDSYARNHFLLGVFDRVLIQHADNLYSCENFSPNIFKIEGGIFKIANDDTAFNNGHGNFEIKVFNILSKIPKNKEKLLYTVHTLELEQINSIVGQGCYSFEDEF